MDVGNIRCLMRKTQSSILENGFLDIRCDDLKLVSVSLCLSFLYKISSVYFLNVCSQGSMCTLVLIISSSSSHLGFALVHFFQPQDPQVVRSLGGCYKENFGQCRNRKPLLIFFRWMFLNECDVYEMAFRVQRALLGIF